MLSEVIVITTKEVHKMMSTDPKIKMDIKMKLDIVSIQEDGDMGTADALRHIQQKIKVCVRVCVTSSWSDRINEQSVRFYLCLPEVRKTTLEADKSK